MNNSITELTRYDIIDYLRHSKLTWSGRLPDEDFLSRVYDLNSMPSTDSRFQTARRDILQHRVSNPDDWPDDWVFTDERFNLLDASDEVFLRFICEMIHPFVRPNKEDVEVLLDVFNRNLSGDGWEIVAGSWISGKPVYIARHHVLKGSPALKGVKPVAETLNAEYVKQQITRMENAVESDPELAIGTAKELVETICKTILTEFGETVSNNDDLLQLVKMVRKKLDLLPEDIPDKAKGADTIKHILNSLGSVAQGVGELRNLYGSGHGKDARVTNLKPRHARLAVGSAATLAVFFFETYQERKEVKK